MFSDKPELGMTSPPTRPDLRFSGLILLAAPGHLFIPRRQMLPLTPIPVSAPQPLTTTVSMPITPLAILDILILPQLLRLSCPPTDPIAPSNLYGESRPPCSQINLAWNDNSNNETGFKIERANFFRVRFPGHLFMPPRVLFLIF